MPDGDFIDVDWVRHDDLPAPVITSDAARQTPAADAPLLVLFHGLEGRVPLRTMHPR
ncbi:MAG: Hydrolase, alpha/beta fold family [uncultured Paraburkholderia sp.]|nr:MAG: Hydrolase, alpha/beta fold family [uncultured Paraburkholderia sp.]